MSDDFRRQCLTCHKRRYLTQFPRDKAGDLGAVCQHCIKLDRKATKIACARCHVQRLPSRFPRLPDNTLAPVCTLCVRAKRRPFGPTARHRALYRSYGLKPHY